MCLLNIHYYQNTLLSSSQMLSHLIYTTALLIYLTDNYKEIIIVFYIIE